MYNEVYIDAVFAANLFVDYLLLRLTATYLRVPVSRKRTFLAAASGALFSCFLLYVQTGMILPLRISLQTGCAIFMVYVLCGPISAERLLQGVLSLYLGAFVLGGLWEAFFPDVPGPGRPFLPRAF